MTYTFPCGSRTIAFSGRMNGSCCKVYLSTWNYTTQKIPHLTLVTYFTPGSSVSLTFLHNTRLRVKQCSRTYTILCNLNKKYRFHMSENAFNSSIFWKGPLLVWSRGMTFLPKRCFIHSIIHTTILVLSCHRTRMLHFTLILGYDTLDTQKLQAIPRQPHEMYHVPRPHLSGVYNNLARLRGEWICTSLEVLWAAKNDQWKFGFVTSLIDS